VSALDLWTTFTGKAELIGAGVVRVNSVEAAERLLNAAAATESLVTRFPEIAGNLPRLAHDKPPAEVAAAGVFAVAETGSVALNEPRLDRGACFLADHLWLLVPADEIVPTLDLAMARLGDLVKEGARHPLLMSGPSRTADIERVLTIGVHGPRELTLVIVE
jgi:L-lactate dehydrogenase complex protein LldG